MFILQNASYLNTVFFSVLHKPAISRTQNAGSSELIALSCIMLIAAGLRFTGLSFGLPHPLCRPDESTIADIAWLVANGDPNPHFFHYPSFLIYVLSALYTARNAFICFFSGDGPPAAAGPDIDPAPYLLIARVVSATLGTATVGVVYALGRTLFDRRTALLSAFFIALCHLHSRDSHFGVTDVPCTFFIVSAIACVALAETRNSTAFYCRGGFLAGMATAIKYGAVFLLPAIAAIRYFSAHRSERPWRDRAFWIFCAAFTAGFALSCPYAILDLKAFIRDLGSEAGHLLGGHDPCPETLCIGLVHHALFTLPAGMGLPMLAAAIFGIWNLARYDPAKSVILLAFPAMYYAFAGLGHTVFARYMIPVLPFLCVSASYAVTQLFSQQRSNAFARIAAALVVLIPAWRAIRTDILLCRRDNRLIAGEWMRQSLPEGSTVYQTGAIFGHALLPPALRQSRLRDVLPDCIVVQRSPLPSSRCTTALESLVSENYSLVREFIAIPPGRTSAGYDVQDAFYLPLAGFRGIERPGPNLFVYRRNDMPAK